MTDWIFFHELFLVSWSGQLKLKIEVFIFSGLYYKHVTIVNYASSCVNKLEASFNDDARVVIYDRRMFVVQATGLDGKNLTLRHSFTNIWHFLLFQWPVSSPDLSPPWRTSRWLPEDQPTSPASSTTWAATRSISLLLSAYWHLVKRILAVGELKLSVNFSCRWVDIYYRAFK